MDPNRMTEKAQDVIRQAQTLAQRHGHQQIDAEHLAVALRHQRTGLGHDGAQFVAGERVLAVRAAGHAEQAQESVGRMAGQPDDG